MKNEEWRAESGERSYADASGKTPFADKAVLLGNTSPEISPLLEPASSPKRKQSPLSALNFPLSKEAFGLYLVITNPLTSYEAVAEAAVKAELRYIQLRMKHVPREEIVAKAHALRAITRGTKTLFIVNDDPEIAVECGADGVHLGQGDMPLPEARRRYPSLNIFGLSTHSYAQMEAAKAVMPDYAGVGPVYATPTKDIPDPTLGPEEAGRIVQASPWPTVAIGGIDEARLPEVLRAGAVNFSVVRAVCQSPTPYDAIRRLQDLWAQFR